MSNRNHGVLAGLVFLAVLFFNTASAQTVPFVNWENHPVHPLDVSPDGLTLAVAHTADNRVQLFDVTGGDPVAIGHVVVGVDPVSVRFRDNNELWVVNHISDTVSVVDVNQRQVIATIQTMDEPADVVFAGSPARAFVSCSQANRVMVFDPVNLSAAAQVVTIQAEEPRALAVSPDGQQVYAAIFESGNGSTILAGGLAQLAGGVLPPNVVNQFNSPYSGQNPPPNQGSEFEPPVSISLPTPPRVGLIVKKNDQGRWMDDNQGDWTDFVSGNQAIQSGRIQGWDLPDRDIAVINAQTLQVSYTTGLMNIGMALAVHPTSGVPTLVGTDAINEVRFEPILNGRFVRVNLAMAGTQKQILDLNSHLDYSVSTVAQNVRDQSIGDPRGIVWTADGQRGYVAGMGSNNVIVVNGSGQRVAGQAPIQVGEGPIGVALHPMADRLFVWNHFEASLSVIDTDAMSEVSRLATFNPLPEAIRNGRQFMYNTRLTSGLGQVSCASCHVDSRIDRLAWDLGDPSGEMKAFNQNCVTDLGGFLDCQDFHPMKGPMMTQTFQDIIGNEPFHWRGDRDGLEEFNAAFEGLLGDDVQLTATEMQAFEDFVNTVTFPPNPFRNLDNSLPTALSLDGQYTSGRFAPAGQPLGVGNAVRGLTMYTTGLLDSPFHCSSCHTLPTGMALNGPLLLGNIGASTGGDVIPDGPFGENHLGIVSTDGSTNVSIKVPQLRNMHEKVGFETTQQESAAGFGFLHDGSVDSLARFLSANAFDVESDQDVADLVALMMAFTGSDFVDPTSLSTEPPPSKDTHAAVGHQLEQTGGNVSSELATLMTQALLDRIDLIVSRNNNGVRESWFYRDQGELVSDQGEVLNEAELFALASADQPLLWTVVPEGLGQRLAIDRDGDTVLDGIELSQGSNPTDADSNNLRARAGLWYNPARSGHGMDLQNSGDNLLITWYTYNDDGSPTWYQAVAPFAQQWQAELSRFEFVDGGIVGTPVGQASLNFSDATHAEFSWTIDGVSGSEPFERLPIASTRTRRRDTGTWFAPMDSGWGLSVYSEGSAKVSIVYFYDADGQPRWVLGSGENIASGQIQMSSFTGFCPTCEFVETQAEDGGTIDLSIDQLTGTVTTQVFYPGLQNSEWVRESAAIIPLTAPDVDYSVF